MELEASNIRISLLTGGKDVHYAFGLLSGLVSHPLKIEFIGNDDWMKFEAIKAENVFYYNLRGNQRINASLPEKIFRVIKYYLKLFKYVLKTDSKLFHIQWLNKFTYFDRTLLNIYYKLLGKKLIFTAHDINFRKLVGKDSLLNKLSLLFMYRIVDHLVVHTGKMKKELVENYFVPENRISIIPFGINVVMPNTELDRQDARTKLNLNWSEKIILFFGNIAPYKGVEILISALNILKENSEDIKLLIAGRVKNNCQNYWENVKELISKFQLDERIVKRIEYIPEDEAEIYFKAADVLILPYKNIFQSGVIYSSYYFGLPVIATDVGSLKDDIVEGKTGFVSNPDDPDDLAKKIIEYFKSDIYLNLENNKKKIIKYANENHSWENTGKKTFSLYKSILK